MGKQKKRVANNDQVISKHKKFQEKKNIKTNLCIELRGGSKRETETY